MTTSLLQSKIISPAPETEKWLATQGREVLAERVREVCRTLSKEGLLDRLQLEREAGKKGGSKLFRIGNSLRVLNEELMILVLAHQLEIPIPNEIWRIAQQIVQFTLGFDELVFGAQHNNPPWKSDLWTADIGLSLAFTAHWNSPLKCDRSAVARFLQEKCCDPIRADWTQPETRIHSLDTMGHNWWSVIVGGAAITEALLGNKTEATRLAALLDEWFQYPGNTAWRKQPNFGKEGDYLESFAYGEYALFRPLELAFLLPDCQVIPRWISREQCCGLTEWYSHAFLRGKDGRWQPQRFGDIPLTYQIRSEVWHPLARLADNAAFLHLAHELKPRPFNVFEFLMWTPESADSLHSSPPKNASQSPRRIFPVSGLAFLGNEKLSVTVRAGEFWNHNHLDAGSFILQQNGVIWADDAGTCKYSAPEYTHYYSSPHAHNVAYVPELAPANNPRMQVEGLPVTGRFLQHNRTNQLEVLQVDTLPLSGGALARSLRWFFVLEGEAVVIWDDLESHQPQRFESLFHTARSLEKNAATEQEAVLDESGELCRLKFFADSPAELSVQSAILGDVCEPDAFNHGEPIGSLEGHCLHWRTTSPVLRQKLGLLTGGSFSNASWHNSENGWELSLQIGNALWSLWINRYADGHVMHRNSINAWRGFETDAYALFARLSDGKETLYGLQTSFVRKDGRVLHSSLQRTGLQEIDLTAITHT
jgi:hypothetical protein